MLNQKAQIVKKAEEMNVEVIGIENVPVIVQGRPLFDFVGVDADLLKALGQNEEDLFMDSGLFNIAVFQDGHVEGLKTVSEQYQVVQHWDAILNVFNSLPDTFDLKKIQIMVSPNGGKCFAKFESGKTIEIKPGDDIKYQLLMENSGDTSSKFSLSGGAWRMICSNGMIIPDDRVEKISKKKLHKGGLSLEGEISEFIGIMDASIESMGIWKSYTEKKLTTPSLEEILKMMEAGPRVQEEILDLELRGEGNTVRNLLTENKLTAWDAYNAFSQRITDSDSLEAVKIERGTKLSQTFDKYMSADWLRRAA